MRTFTIVMFLAFISMASMAMATSKLEDFNKYKDRRMAADDLSENVHLVSQFKAKNFVCRNATQFTPKESDAAARAFSEFVEYNETGGKTENFWMDAANKQKRENLLSAALKAGSWKADYVDSVWSIRFPKGPESAKDASARLVKLVEKGVPIAVYKYATYLFGRDDKDMYYLLDAAIDRGSPHAMALVGGNIVVQSRALRPLGKALLECAASQGHADAYYSLGELANMESRQVDAYRFWEKGINEGCEECIRVMRDVAWVRGFSLDGPAQDSSVDKLTMEDYMPELQRIKKFYDKNFFYEISELPEFYLPLPDELIFQLSDAELLKTLRWKIGLRD